ncbi:MAG: hypothetical protein ABI054_03170 [Planctomycetota bacterium]
MISIASTELWTRAAMLVAPLLVAVVFVVFAMRHMAREVEKRKEAWNRFAIENRLKLSSEPSSWLRRGELHITGQVGGMELDISTYQVRAGKSTRTWVRVRTLGAGPAGSFSVQRENLLTRAGALIGMGGTDVGQPEFDKEFLVRSAPETLAAEVLDAPLREHIAGLARQPRLSYTDGAIDLVWHAGDDSKEQLSAAVQLHAMLRGAFVRMTRRVG